MLKKVSNKYGIKYQTLLNKYHMYINKNNKFLNINDKNRGGYNKVFTEHEEYEIYLFLKNNFIDENQMLCNDIIKFHAQDEYQKIYKNNNFHASDGWCNMFKQRWNLSTVKCSISKIATKIYTDAEINDFLKKCSDRYMKVGSFFFNLDETKWNNINVSLTTIHIKNSDNAKININGNEKEGFTLTLIISVDGKMLIPILTAKGKTKNSLKKYCIDNDKIIGTYSNNGWTNSGIIKICLDQIFKITNGKNSILLLDQYPSHCNDFIEKYSKDKNIELIYVPVGLTYKYQPLDVSINGILKQKSKML